MKKRQDGGNAADQDFLAQPISKMASRRPYTAPALVEYGTIAKLTQGSKTRSNDGSNTRKLQQPCL